MTGLYSNSWPEWLNLAALFWLPVFLYGEMHYRLPFIKGFLYRNQPEILFDLPYRTETGVIPVLLLIKDAHWFPVTVEKVLIRLMAPGGHEIYKEISVPVNKQIHQKWFHRIIEIDAAGFKNQWLNVDCYAFVTLKGKSKIIHNDNYRTLSQRPFRIFVDPDPLPGEKGWVWGDLHCHSAFTEDQAEFGAPPECYRAMAHAMGISFIALTEHSYDMDDSENSWTDNDPQLLKWKKFRREIQNLNRTNRDFLIIPGEEVSVDNGFGRTVHMGVLNDPEFHIGSGDGMEHSLGKETEFHYASVLHMTSENSLTFAAHPFDNPPWLHRLIIHRGSWNPWDTHPLLHGFQILNGNGLQDFATGKEFWIKQLLQGRRQLIYAGNDSHGNFNRYRQIVLPLLFMREHRRQIFGYNLTGIKSSLNKGVTGLINDLKQETVIISSGPFINLTHDPGKSITLTTKSTVFFGALKEISIYLGNLVNRRELKFHTESFQKGQFAHTIRLPVVNIPERGYFRAELTTDRDRFAVTNPLWFN